MQRKIPAHDRLCYEVEFVQSAFARSDRDDVNGGFKSARGLENTERLQHNSLYGQCNIEDLVQLLVLNFQGYGFLAKKITIPLTAKQCGITRNVLIEYSFRNIN